MGHLLGYARVSTADQNPDLQLDALKSAGCYRLFVDRVSGALEERGELARVLDQLRPGDTLVVWKLDRLGRSLRHLIDTVGDLQQRGVGFRSLQESIDTTTSTGKLVFHLFGALAEFERDLIRERTLAGLESARARGRLGGRPVVMSPEKVGRRAGDVPLSAAHRGGDRKDPRGQPRIHIPPPRTDAIRPGAGAEAPQEPTVSVQFTVESNPRRHGSLRRPPNRSDELGDSQRVGGAPEIWPS